MQGAPPSYRDFHTAVAMGHKMYVFGGRGDASGPYHSQEEIYCNKVLYLDTLTNEWVQPETSGWMPKGRRSHSACNTNSSDVRLKF
jgi:N-acetylneuraminic acid mutarotase